ncbi:MAG: hypothetical protein JOY68_11395 [Candidatus Dormibacteraeota bacterium]|nr:hypothetical protein [Candidatus Dormibacteraeota bacterium]
MDNRTGFRPKGHAFLAEQARRTLGVTAFPVLAEIPMPLVHTALGAAVCGVAVVVRPEALGLRNSAIADVALALLTAIVLVGYDLLVYPKARRPGLEGAALPTAAVGAFGVVLAGVTPISIRLAAGVVATLVIGGVPQLAGRRLIDAEGGIIRLLRDIAGIAVLTPVLVAGASPVLDPLWRGAVVGAITVLVSFDGLRTENLSIARAIPLAFVLGAVLAGATVVIPPSSAQIGARAAVLLVFWYGLRGMAGVFAAENTERRLTLLEYGVFVALAIGALRWFSLQT